MPHKMNTRSSERINGFGNIIKGYENMLSRLSGNQWEEGDVSCSVVRRVAIPDSFYASDGLCETTLTILNNMGPYPAVINKELDKYLPFLATTEILMMAIKAGMGREEAHEVIKKYAVSEALKMRQKDSEKNNLANLLGDDSLFIKSGITEKEIYKILEDKLHFVGNARSQINSVVENVNALTQRYSDEANYEPGNIL